MICTCTLYINRNPCHLMIATKFSIEVKSCLIIFQWSLVPNWQAGWGSVNTLSQAVYLTVILISCEDLIVRCSSGAISDIIPAQATKVCWVWWSATKVHLTFFFLIPKHTHTHRGETNTDRQGVVGGHEWANRFVVTRVYTYIKSHETGNVT